MSIFDEVYLHSLYNQQIRNFSFSTLLVIQHLCDTCANVVEHDLSDNENHLKSAHDSSLPFEILIDQVEDELDCTAVEKAPCTKNIRYRKTRHNVRRATHAIKYFTRD